MIRTTVGAGLLALATVAAAQGPGAPYPVPGPGPMGGSYRPPMPQPPTARPPMGQPPMARPMPGGPGGGRWGSQVGGRWWGGVNAPGGYGAYRAPVRGYRLPSYWLAPRFYVNDFDRYGFTAPGEGYFWSRYYDDAVLIDGRGQVWDTVHGVDWDGQGGYGPRRPEGNGLAGAAIGAGVGGLAGNVIAGRGNRLGGTLIGAGVGAAAGYAIGHQSDGYRDDRRGPGRGYPPPPPPQDGYRYNDRGESGHPPSWVSADGGTTVTVTTAGGQPPVLRVAPEAYAYGGYGGGITTVTVQSAPVVTTTTTEIVEDRVNYTRPAYRRVVVRRPVCRCAPVRRWHPRPARVMGS